MSKKKLYLSFLLIFVAGILIGGVASRMCARNQMFKAMNGGQAEMRKFLMKRLTSELSLSADQQAKIEPIVKQTQDEAAQVRLEQRPRMEAILDKASTAANTILTPDQQDKLGKLRQQLRERWDRKLKE